MGSIEQLQGTRIISILSILSSHFFTVWETSENLEVSNFLNSHMCVWRYAPPYFVSRFWKLLVEMLSLLP